jgi:hypothetical protein
MNDIVANKNHFHCNQLGASALTAIVNMHQQDATLFQEKDIMPVTFESASLVYNNKTMCPEDIVQTDAVLFKLFDEPFKKELSNSSVEQLYNSQNFLGKLFRIALPKSAFKLYCLINRSLTGPPTKQPKMSPSVAAVIASSNTLLCIPYSLINQHKSHRYHGHSERVTEPPIKPIKGFMPVAAAIEIPKAFCKIIYKVATPRTRATLGPPLTSKLKLAPSPTVVKNTVINGFLKKINIKIRV